MAIPFTKHLTLSFDGDEVQAALTTATLTDEPEGSETLTTFTASEDIAGTPKRSLEISGYQSWKDATDVFELIHQAYLLDPHGEIDVVMEVGSKTRTFTAVPQNDPPFGGDAGAAMTAEVTLSVVGDVTDGTVVTP